MWRALPGRRALGRWSAVSRCGLTLQQPPPVAAHARRTTSATAADAAAAHRRTWSSVAVAHARTHTPNVAGSASTSAALSSPSPYYLAAQRAQLHLHALALAPTSSAATSARPDEVTSSTPSSNTAAAASSSTNSADSTTAATAATAASTPRKPRITLRTLPYDVRRFLLTRIPFATPLQELSKLIKTELSVVVTMSSAFGFLLAGSEAFNATHVLANFAGTIACASAAAIGNQYMEVQFDKQMPRTQNRPLVTGYFSRPFAIGLGVGLAGIGAPLLHYAAAGDWVAPALGLGTIVLYTQVYTRMKRFHRWNTEVGAVVGAVPVLIGWSCAVANWSHHMQLHHHLSAPISTLASLTMPHAVYGFAFLAAWQMQHFMTIAFKEQDSYAKAGYKMMQGKQALHKGMAWVGILTAMPFLAPYLGVTSGMFIYTGSAINAYLIWAYARWHRAMNAPLSDPVAQQRAARSCMVHGILYFFLMFTAIIVHALDNKYHLVRNFIPTDMRTAAMALCTHPAVQDQLRLEQQQQQQQQRAHPHPLREGDVVPAGEVAADGCIQPSSSDLSNAHLLGSDHSRYHEHADRRCIYLQIKQATLQHFEGNKEQATAPTQPAAPASSPAQ